MQRPKPLIYTLVKTLRETDTKTHCNPLHDVKIEEISGTLAKVEATKVGDTWADTVGRVKIRTTDKTLGQLPTEALINTPSDVLA